MMLAPETTPRGRTSSDVTSQSSFPEVTFSHMKYSVIQWKK